MAGRMDVRKVETKAMQNMEEKKKAINTKKQRERQNQCVDNLHWKAQH
jgi:hypothetical protein